MEFCGNIIGNGTGKRRMTYWLCAAFAMTFVSFAGCNLPSAKFGETSLEHNASIVPNLAIEKATPIVPDAAIVPDVMSAPNAAIVPDVMSAPDTAIVPDVMSAPDAPTVPDVMSALDAAIVPDVMSAPDAPTVPDLPGVPDVPIMPDLPIAPVTPDAPTVPDTPIVPDAPTVPEIPNIAGDEAVPSPPLEESVPEKPSEESGGTVAASPGFLVDEAGMIYKFVPEESEVLDGCLKLPSEGCSGILSGAFDGVDAGICDVEIPPNITYIEEGALSGLTELYGIWTDDANPNYISPDGVLLDKSKTTILSFPSARIGIYEIPGYVTRLADHAFSGTNLSKLSMRGCKSIEVGSAIFGSGDGAGVTVLAPRDLLAEYQDIFAGYHVTVK